MSKPTTGEIVRALRDAPNYNGMAGTTTTVEGIAADHLESQEQTIAAMTARAEAAEEERDRAIKQMRRFCKSLDKKAGIKPVCAADCEWRGLQAGKGDAPNE